MHRKVMVAGIVCALNLVGWARVWAGAAQAQGPIRVALPGRDWALELQAPGFVQNVNGPMPDGREYLLANNEETWVEVSVFLESPNGKPAKDCPTHLKQTLANMAEHFEVNTDEATWSEVNSIPVTEFMIHSLKGLPIEQKNLLGCTEKDDVFVDIHISKQVYKEGEEHLLIDALNSLQFVPIVKRGFTVNGATGGTVTVYPKDATLAGNANSTPHITSAATPTPPEGKKEALYYFLAGGRLWLAKDYKGAIAPYEKALELEKKNPTLSRDYWRVLVDSLGMAYGMNGDLDRAEATLRYGVSKDPDYPMFYYNLACASGERGNMNAAMKYLREAFARKQNSIAGESVPDPRTDDSFRKFMSNAEFKEFADGLVEGKE